MSPWSSAPFLVGIHKRHPRWSRGKGFRDTFKDASAPRKEAHRHPAINGLLVTPLSSLINRLEPLTMVGSFSSWLATVVVFGVAVITDARCVNGTDREVLPEFASKPRYFLMTDILNEPDDEMSLVRYLLYTDQVETRGLCATTSATLPNSTHPEAIEKIVNAYGVVVDNLNSHAHPSSQFPQTDELLALITSGPKVQRAPPLSSYMSIGSPWLTEATVIRAGCAG